MPDAGRFGRPWEEEEDQDRQKGEDGGDRTTEHGYRPYEPARPIAAETRKSYYFLGFQRDRDGRETDLDSGAGSQRRQVGTGYLVVQETSWGLHLVAFRV
jgi:hypothetical protein